MAGIVDAFLISGSGMRAQGDRMRVVAQNLANVDSTGTTPGATPYQRKTITFKSMLDQDVGVEKIAVAHRGLDKSPFKRKFEPGHPAADAQGYVLYPNVDSIIELVDMRETQRNYEANLNVADVSRTMINQAIDMLR